MRSILFTSAVVIALASTVSCQDFLAPSTLAEDYLDIPYSRNLSCGACIRSGRSYCINKKDDKTVGRGAGDVCCDDEKCVIDMIALRGDDEKVCGTTLPQFNETDIYYKDSFNMLQKFCMKRQNSTACCGRKDPKDKCELEMKY
jgi:hypothetical protein